MWKQRNTRRARTKKIRHAKHAHQTCSYIHIKQDKHTENKICGSKETQDVLGQRK